MVRVGAKDEPTGAVCRSVGGVNHNEGGGCSGAGVDHAVVVVAAVAVVLDRDR